MKTGLVDLNNILEAPKGNSGNNQNNNNFKRNSSDLWDF
jgi:hypothetical protein